MRDEIRALIVSSSLIPHPFRHAEREPEAEAAACALLRFDRERAAQGLRQRVRDCQAEPGAFALILRREEGVEDAYQHLGRDAVPGVRDLYRYALADAVRRDRNRSEEHT